MKPFLYFLLSLFFPLTTPKLSSISQRQLALTTVSSILSNPLYKDGTLTSQMDSASFISHAFEQQNIYLPKQLENLLEIGQHVSINNLQIGDLIFFTTEGYTTDQVGILVTPTSLCYIPKRGEALHEVSFDRDLWYGKFITARRVTGSELISTILEKMYQKEITQSYFQTYISGTEKNNDPGYLRFYIEDISEKQILISESSDGTKKYGNKTQNENAKLQKVKQGIVPRSKTNKRPFKKKHVEFITIHDTGDATKNASQWKKEVTTSDRAVSWHFTVDHSEIYQHLPLDEWGRHAGDGLGEHLYKLIDTGVAYTVAKPKIEFNKNDHHLYINGKKSSLVAGKLDGKYYHDITPSGLYTQKGSNGNYYIDQYYINSDYKVNANSGGNTHSVGIETCIFKGVKYSKVMRKTANLAARLLHMYNLGTNRVMQHRHFSGKTCPQSMIKAGSNTPFGYNQFTALVEINDFIIKKMPNAKFTYKSNNPDILGNDGYLLKYVTKDTNVSYSVTVTYGGETVTKTYTTTIHPKK